MKIVSVVIVFMINSVIGQDNGQEILSVGVDGLLMENAQITASETCGMNGPEKYCRLVDERSIHTPSNQASNVLCDICDDRNLTKRHPIEYAKSNDDNLWWQSPSKAQGLKYENVSVTIDLKQVYQIVYILLKMGDSPRPGTWILERSLEGLNYLPWIFFAETPYSCYNLFQKHYPELRLTTSARPHLLDDDEIFCTTYYSQPKSLNSGEIIISLINGRKSLMIDEHLTTKSVPEKLINFLSARFIRFRFLKHLTLAAELMTDKGYLEKSIYNRYYYSLRNIEIGGKCICNNHAEKCDKVVENSLSVSKCSCKHNTCGNNCETCCPLFNQKPWRPIVPCEECNCNRKSQECVYNQTVATLQLSTNKMGRMDGGGVCLNCQENTEGINCEKCKKGFYRPWNVLAIEPFPCKPCNCNGIGTFGHCVSNGEEFGNQKPGDCICKTGYTGENCQLCSMGYEQSSNGECLPCPCSIEGGVTNSLYRCKPPCNCKRNVEPMSDCKTCKTGYFNLDPKNPEGCQPCYCFGITNQCTSLNARSLEIHDLTNWKISTISDTKQAYPIMTALQYPSSENNYIDTFFNNPMVYYWIAPAPFLGNWLISYGSVLKYVVKIDLASKLEGSQIDSPDVIIKCGKSRLFHSVSNEDRRLQRKVFIYLKHSYWNIGELTPLREATKEEFISCLVNVESFMIKAKYYSNQITIGLLNITLYRGMPNMAFNEMPYIEKCICKPGYAGLSCESCEAGYRRVNNTFFQGRCEPCACFDHSDTCDPFSGQCKNCLHNTDGPNCNECIVGYYGNPQSRKENSCKKCACPLLDHQMSDRCSTISPEGYICHDCKNNTFGPHCDRCKDGFYGNPKMKIPCQKCPCNDNEDSCSENKGECKCSFKTTGRNCEFCKDGFFGNARNKTCSECECSPIGSENQQCDRDSGRCTCKINFINRKCDSCVLGFYLNDGKCVPCVCDALGMVFSQDFCHASTGKCFCRSGITGDRCDRCLPGYYGFPNCKKCNCSSHALSNECDKIDGSCKCGSLVADKNCERCLDMHYWTNRTHCAPCNCGRGATSDVCDTNNGSCKCANNVILRDCSKCKIGYYGLSPSGCTECPTCPIGQVCNNEGICTCPPNTMGQFCEKCSDDSWDYNGTFGCKKCHCSVVGSVSERCDKISGQCPCRNAFSGLKCTNCQNGYYGFPNCKPCNCSTSGTKSEWISKCDSTSGQCVCKENAQGKKCDQCKSGTFPSGGDYEGGCYSCFCFGMSDRCKPLLNHRIVKKNVYQYQIFNDTIDNKNPDLVPLNSSQIKNFNWPFNGFRSVYADISQLLKLNDLTLFYRSTIMDITINCLDTNCGRENSIQTEVIFDSYNGLLQMAYIVNYSLTNLDKIQVELSERPTRGKWLITKYRAKPVNKVVYLADPNIMDIRLARDIFMMALLNVTSIKVQLFPKSVVVPVLRIKIQTYDAKETSNNEGKLITSVEKCQCNSITSGNHCQKPVDGYFKVITLFPELNEMMNERTSNQIVINVKKCDCNGHSSQCDGISGICQNCSDNTTGNKCEQCADGYHGDPTNFGQCQPCQCPSEKFNYAKKCNKSSLGNNYQCLCLPGYMGSLCETCEFGYYGNPMNGIDCKPCQCNREGSVNWACDMKGVCRCFPGIEGDKCDKCAANHVVENRKCKSCLTGCTKTLFERVDALNFSLTNLNWKSLPIIFDKKIQELNITMEKIAAHLLPLDRFYNFMHNFNNFSTSIRMLQMTLKEDHSKAMKFKIRYIEAFDKLFLILKHINETITMDKTLLSSDVIIRNATNILEIIIGLFNEIPNITEPNLLLSDIKKHNNDLMRILAITNDTIRLQQLTNLRLLHKKTLLAHDINMDNREYLKKLKKKFEDYNLQINQLQNRINNSEELFQRVTNKKYQLQGQMLEFELVASEYQNQNQSITDTLRSIKDLLALLSTNGSGVKKFIIPDLIKQHVENQLNKSSSSIKKMTQKYNFLHNAEQAREAYSNISRDIMEVDKVINETEHQLDNSNSTLNLIKMAEFFNQSNSNKSNLEEKYLKIFAEFNNLKTQYLLLNATQLKLNANNQMMKSKIPSGYGDINPLKLNLSQIKSNQTNNQTEAINDILSAFKIESVPELSNKTDEIEKSVDNLKQQYAELMNDTMDLNTKIKKMRDNIKSLRERLAKARTMSELIHGGAARSAEPIRHVEGCVRHYITYYLPKSIAFSLEFYMRPQFPGQTSLVLFGYDDSQAIPQSFAFTIERNKQFTFWYEERDTVKTISVTKDLPNDNYAGVLIAWKLGRWEMSIKSIGENVDSQADSYSNAYNMSNSVRIGPQTNVFVGGFPSAKLLGNLKLKGKLISKLRENYASSFYKGCLFDMRLMNSEFGLQDVEAIDEDCKKTISTEHLLLHPFNCKLSRTLMLSFQRKNLAKVNTFKQNTIQTRSSQESDSDIIFSGNGYAMINTSKITGGSCKIKLNKVLSISAIPIPVMNPETFQLIAAFSNNEKDIGFVLGQKRGYYQFGFWNGSYEKTLTQLQSVSENFHWNIFQSNVKYFNENIFGIDDICHSNSLIFLGDIPSSEFTLIDRLKRLNVPNFGFTGNMKLLVNQKNEFQTLATRFVNVVFLQAERFNADSFNSLFISTGVNQYIDIRNSLIDDVLKYGFSFSVDFMGQPITKTITLLTIELTPGDITVEITKNLEFIFIVNQNQFIKKLKRYDEKLDWGSHSVAVSFIYGTALFISIVVDNGERETHQLTEPLGQQSFIRIGFNRNEPTAYYFYHLFLGQRLINFNELSGLPPGVFLKRPVTQLQPLDMEQIKINSSQPAQRVSNKHGQILQYDAAAPPLYTNSKISLPLVQYKPSTYILYSSKQLEDYPSNSAWFDGMSGEVILLNADTISQYEMTEKNEISFMIRSASLRSEMLLSLDLKNGNTINIVTINGYMVMLNSSMDPIVEFPTILVDKEWHRIQITSSNMGSNTGIRIYQDNNLLDYEKASVSFSFPSAIRVGGFDGPILSFLYKKKRYEPQPFTGCMNGLKINNKTVPITNLQIGSVIKQCPRVLEFLNNGGHLMSNYSQEYDSNKLIKLKTENYTAQSLENAFVVKFKFKFNGYESGSMLITGDGNKFCAISIGNRKIRINYRDFATRDTSSESLDINKEKWYTVDFIVFHTNYYTICKMQVDDLEVSLTFFSSNFVKPDFYFGGHPNLSAEKVKELTQTGSNFVGCISDIAFFVNGASIPSGFDKSGYIIGGRCSIDKMTYLLRKF